MAERQPWWRVACTWVETTDQGRTIAFAHQSDFTDSRLAWVHFHAERNAFHRGKELQVDLYDGDKGRVIEQWRAGQPERELAREG